MKKHLRSEIEYMPLKRIRVPKQYSWMDVICTIALVALLIVATYLIHKNIEPPMPIVPVAHADEKPMTDREQEQMYCAMWATSKEAVVGGSSEEIRKHCAKYL